MERLPLARQLPVALGQLVQQRFLLGAQGHAARRGLGHGGPARLELGDKRLAQKVAVIAHVLIALILHPAKGEARRRLGQLGATHIEQRPQQQAAGKGLAWQDPRQPTQTGAALEGQQQGLQLIVLMVGGEQPLPLPHPGGQPLVTGGARLRLQTLAIAAGQSHPLDQQLHRQLLTHGFTMSDPLIGMGTEAVVHVQGAKRQAVLAGILRRQHQQQGGVEAATEGHQQTGGTFRRWHSQTKARIKMRNHRLPQNGPADLSRVGLIKLQPCC